MDACYGHIVHRVTWDQVSDSFGDSHCYCLLSTAPSSNHPLKIFKLVVKIDNNTVIVHTILRHLATNLVCLQGAHNVVFNSIPSLLRFGDEYR